MNKEELYGCYIATKNITSEDEWNKITDKLISLGFGEAGVDRGFKCIKSWPQLSIEKDDRFLLRCEGTGSKEIKISDILGEETKFEVGKYYSYIWNWGNVGKCICKVSKVTEVQMKAEWDYTVSGKSFRTPGVGATNLHEISDIKELTLEEIQQYLPDNHPDKIAKEFTLPKKWYIQATGENQKVVGAWLMKNDYQPNITDLDKGGYTDWYFKYPRGSDCSGSQKKPSEDYIEITFEQFKRYVLKESKLLTVYDLVEGEIYYCENTYLTGGRHGYVFLKNGDNGIKHLVIEGLKFLKKGWSFWADKDTINLRATTPEEKHWLLTSIKQDKFIPKEDLSKYDSEGNLITKNDVKQKQVVHCTNEEQWDFVQKKHDPTSNWPWHNSYDKEGYCKRLDVKGHSEHLDYYKKDPEYKILSFQEWLDLNGYTFTGKIANKFNVGDYVISLITTPYGRDEGDLLLITGENSYTIITTNREELFNGVITSNEIAESLRLATLEEIKKVMKPKAKEMQSSDLKNPVFNIGDKVRVIADSLREFNDSWTDGNNTGYKKGYVGIITDIGGTSNYEVNAWCYLEDSISGISCNLLELVEPVKSKVDRNVYYEVETQEQYNEILDWLESEGEKVDRNFDVIDDWRYVFFLNNDWNLINKVPSSKKAEFKFKDKPETQPIKTGIGLSEQILQYPYQYGYKTIDSSSVWEVLMNPPTQNSRAELKQESKVQNFIPEIPKVKNRFKTSPIKKRSLPEIY